MVCPICNGKVGVIDGVYMKEENYRKRKCKECSHIFYTVEFEVERDERFKGVWNFNHRWNLK